MTKGVLLMKSECQAYGAPDDIRKVCSPEGNVRSDKAAKTASVDIQDQNISKEIIFILLYSHIADILL